MHGTQGAAHCRRTSHTPQMVPSTRPRNMPRTPLCSPTGRGLAATAVAAGALAPPLAAASEDIAGGTPAVPAVSDKVQQCCGVTSWCSQRAGVRSESGSAGTVHWKAWQLVKAINSTCMEV